jgi:hypothetical protein
VIARRLRDEVATEIERLRAPRRAASFDERALLRTARASSIDELWERCVARAPVPEVEPPSDVVARAEAAVARRVDLLGSGPVDLGPAIDWLRDPTTGVRWERGYAPRLAYVRLGVADVKLPWEISRVQWLLPAGQAFAATGEERYAAAARDVLDEWIAGNPYAGTVNWSVTMEVALRVLTWSWLLGALGRSESWRDPAFRSRFLRALWLHGDYTRRHLERSDVNGNHFTADAAGLAFAGLLFDDDRWRDEGWQLLLDELPQQVHDDGVDFEASAAYHRLVGELFALPMLYREQLGLSVPAAYRSRVEAMARFTAAITGPDGLTPLWGDADDARALPLDGRPTRDHRGFRDLLGVERADRRSFPAGGVYVLAAGADHVFIDCGPVGLAGRGGHGHNDCLSFEAVLDGVRLVTDSGSYVYTSDPEARNCFRSTAAHNTPRVDGAEQNRIPESLWQLVDDAQPEPLLDEELRFRGSHTGYRRLADPVRPVRTIALEPELHALLVADRFEGGGEHAVEVPFHFVPGIDPVVDGRDVRVGGFLLRHRGDWERTVEDAWVSPSYGVREPARRVVFRRTGALQPLLVVLAPADADERSVWSWAEAAAA